MPVKVLSRGQRPGIPGSNPTQAYRESKKTLVVRVRRSKTFETCKPSAHYQIPLATSCPGMCEYCYLQTRLGSRPYIRTYANIEEILEEARRLMEERAPKMTIFEGAATSDPLAIEWLTGSLKKAIEFFGRSLNGRFRFVTKFSDVEPILDASHFGHTTVRFSVNARYVVWAFEHGTSDLGARVEALARVKRAGYPVGVMIGPIILFEGWQEQYGALLDKLGEVLSEPCPPPSDFGADETGATEQRGVPFELISHRFTARAKSNILSVFPNTNLPLDESSRRLAFGQFGYAKHVYPKDDMRRIEDFFSEHIPRSVEGGYIQYLV